MSEPVFDYQFQLIVLGNSSTGKTSLLRAFTNGRFPEVSDPTIGVDYFSRLVKLPNGVRVKFQLWDTSGHERFRSMTRSYYRNNVGALLLYDITRRSSFEHLIDWLFEARHHSEPQRTVFEVVACKVDMENAREVTTEEGRAFADFYGMQFVETSAKTGYNVEEAFTIIAQEIYEKIESGEFKVDGSDGIKCGFTRPSPRVHLLEAEPKGGSCC